MYIIKIVWQDIIEKFHEKFKAIYFDGNKQKLYFCFDERVDGAKDTWMLIAFVDAILQKVQPGLTTGN